MEWWLWPLALFAVTFALGVVAVLAGIGGGVLFVPIVSGFFPFHLDFVRAAGLLLALTGALSAAPALLRSGLTSIRLALPAQAVQIALGVAILAIAALMWWSPQAESQAGAAPDAVTSALGMHGVYHDAALANNVTWQASRTPAALVAFGGIGVLAGMFGLGAGWANVPVLNLLMGLPLKLSVGTSGFILSVIDTSAVWIYLNR